MQPHDRRSSDEKIDAILHQLAAINRAFPDGPEAHRISHEAMMRSAAAQTQFWEQLKLDVAKKGTWGLLVIILGLILVGAATKFGISVGVK